MVIFLKSNLEGVIMYVWIWIELITGQAAIADLSSGTAPIYDYKKIMYYNN